MKNTLIALASLVLACTVLAEQKPYNPKHPTGSAEFERIKTLTGTWTGTMKKGDKDMPMTVIYRESGGGSAVVETWNPGTPMEMVSVYHDQKGKLVMTHYCMLGNQPKLKLDKKNSSDGSIAMNLVKGSIDEPGKPHMGGLVLKILEKDKIQQTWSMCEGEKCQAMPLVLTRK